MTDEITQNSEEPEEEVEMPEGNAGDADSDDKLVFKRSHLYSVLLPLAFVLGLSVGYLFWGRNAGTVQPAAQVADAQPAPAQAQGTQAVKRYDVPVDDDPAIGPADAPITLIEFSDFECPYCRRWHDQVYTRLRQEYPNQVRIVFRDFPLSSLHANAIPAAEAADCANEQGAFWEFQDKLFSGEYELGSEAYLQYANDLGLDAKQFQECVDTGRYNDEVMADYQFASNLGVRSTPTFFLNGIPLVGAQPYEMFKQVIDQELAGEIP
jgi:protein-disulfide isomerase